MPKGIPKNGINLGWFTRDLRPWAKTGLIKICRCGKQFYCEKGKIIRKKFCSVPCRNKFHPKGYKFTEETKRKMSKIKKGKKLSLFHRKQLSLAQTGRKQSETQKENNRKSQIKRWDRIGRKEYKRYIHLCGTREYKEWRKSVFERDNYKCKMCGLKGYLEAHHILAWRDYPELRYEVNNGITLCKAHHPRKRAEEKRLSPYFQELVSVSKDDHS